MANIFNQLRDILYAIAESRVFQTVASSLQIPNPRQFVQLPLIWSLSWSGQNTDDDLLPTSSCPNAQLSCHNTSAITNTCCFNSPGGQFLQTQFWDTNPPNGPQNSWTIHGLWPDHCDGGFDQFCDNTRKYNNITDILHSLNATDLLKYMNIYWRADRGSDESLWSHEWNKHGTCISTLGTSCYKTVLYKPQQEVHDYFHAAVKLFRRLNTYKTLADASVHPSHDKTYTLASLMDPLTYAQGSTVTLRCHGNVLNEIWYHFDVLGSVQTGEFVPAPPDGAKGNCPATGIKYLPKGEDTSPTSTVTSTRTATTTGAPTGVPTLAPFTGRGTLQIHVVDDDQAACKDPGCLISDGQWYSSGTCANYRAQDDAKEASNSNEHLFTLVSSKGPCSILDGYFQCAKNLPVQTVFSANGSRLMFQGSTRFSAKGAPGRFEKVPVYPEVEMDGDEGVQIEVIWE